MKSTGFQQTIKNETEARIRILPLKNPKLATMKNANQFAVKIRRLEFIYFVVGLYDVFKY